MIQRPDDRLTASHGGSDPVMVHDRPAGDLDMVALRRLFARRWKVVAGTVAVITGLTLAAISLLPATFEAAVPLLLSGPVPPVGSSPAASVRTLLTGPVLLAEVAAQVSGPPIQPDDVFVDPVPNTPFVRIRVHDHDPQRASAIARQLGERAVAASRQLRAQAFKSDTPADRSQLEAALAELRNAEERMVEFQLQSNIDLLRREDEIRLGRQALGTRPQAPAARPAAEDPETKSRQELYRAELAFKRIEEEYELARSAYITELARVKQVDAPVTSIPLVEIVEGEAPPAYPVGRDRVRLTLLAFAASLLLGVALVVLIELLAGGVRPGRRPQVAG
jgi:uncharacterized protein involved in exopolysaccharide biosynthesis